MTRTAISTGSPAAKVEPVVDENPTGRNARRTPGIALASLLWLVFSLSSTWASAAVVEHDLRVGFDPTQGRLEVADRIRLPPGLGEQPEFALLATLEPRLTDGRLQTLGDDGRFRRYRVLEGAADGQIEVVYRGRVDLPEPRRGHGMPIGVIDTESVYLDGASGWYPRFGDQLLRFRLQVALPEGWHSVSQGAREVLDGRELWREAQPQDDIYLLAAPFERYSRPGPGAELSVYLLAPDEALAGRYLDAMAEFVELYSSLIGPYPYAKFALVENRWQTGYGMPSFTLLGSRVIRLPFILRSSLPHEILHNWWGNGVYIDYRRGNWSEGLTAYLADHLLKELDGEDAGYRQRTLERYANFAAQGRDRALRAFVSRHSEASQAVGYGKSLMLFHMLRRGLGDAEFIAGLRRFWRDFAFREAGFDDLIAAFSKVAGRDLAPELEQWLARTGAPQLELGEVASEREGAGYRLRLRLRQTQGGPAYRLQVPVAVTLEGEREARLLHLGLDQADARVDWRFDARPLRVDVDPAFDLFRQLGKTERPPSLGRLFGAERALMILPRAATEAQRQAWEQLAAAWMRRYRNLTWIYDDQIDALPDEAATWVVGWENRWLAEARARVGNSDQSLDGERIRIGAEEWGADQAAAVLLDPDNGRGPFGLILARGLETIHALARKLTHYGSFGQLVFTEPGANNLHRAALPITRSPLSRQLGDAETALKLPARPRLTGMSEPSDIPDKPQ